MVRPTEEEAYALLEQWLTAAPPQANPAFRHRLRAQLLQEIKQEKPKMIVRNRPYLWRLAGVGLALALLLLLVLTPAGQALADFLELGWYRFTGAPTLAEEHIAAGGDDGQTVTLDTRRFASAAAASVEAGFTVLIPTYLPEGYHAQRQPRPVSLVLGTDGSVRHASVDYLDPDFSYYLGFEQASYDPSQESLPIEMGLGDAEAQQVAVGGSDGVFFENIIWGSKPDESGALVPVRYNVLLWQREIEGQQFLFWLHSGEQLSLAEMLRIAESLAP